MVGPGIFSFSRCHLALLPARAPRTCLTELPDCRKRPRSKIARQAERK
jgi:hypothetical protein